MKPVMNLDEVQFDDIEENGFYTSSRGWISDHIGARKLGYNYYDREDAGDKQWRLRQRFSVGRKPMTRTFLRLAALVGYHVNSTALILK